MFANKAVECIYDEGDSVGDGADDPREGAGLFLTSVGRGVIGGFFRGIRVGGGCGVVRVFGVFGVLGVGSSLNRCVGVIRGGVGGVVRVGFVSGGFGGDGGNGRNRGEGGGKSTKKQTRQEEEGNTKFEGELFHR